MKLSRRALMGLAALPFVRAQPNVVVFPQGVASGDPSDSGVVLWTRVAPEAYQAGAALRVEIAETADFAAPVYAAPVAIPFGPGTDYTVQIDFSGLLKPATRYYYRFRYRDSHSPIGRTKTLPAPGQMQPLRIGLVTCQEFGGGYYGAFAHLAQEDLDAVLHLGDFIYEYSADPDYRRERFAGRSFRLPSNSLVALGLEDYRTLYKAYRADPFLKAALAVHPWIFMWDDHEFANDCYYDAARNAPGAPDHPFKDQPERLRKLRLEANQAWREYVPSRVSFNPQASDPREQLSNYRSFRFGEMLELFVTDTRSFRSAHACGEDHRALTNCPAQLDPGRSLLGLEQKRWLLQGLKASTARWRGLGSAVMFSPLQAAGLTINQDGWDGYLAEREGVLQALAQDKVNNLVVLSGDLHAALAGQIAQGFSKAAPQMGMEFMTPAISSPNASESLTRRGLPWPGNGIIEALNSHLDFFAGDINGYSVLEFAADGVTYWLYAVDKAVNRPDAAKQLVHREWFGKA